MIARVGSGAPRVGITGIGAYAPERVLTNADLVKMVDTSDEWIVERTGIRQRHVAEPDQATSDIAAPAAREALECAGVAPEEVELVVVATASPNMLFPASASFVAEEIGARNAAAYDLLAGCTGFVHALSQGYAAVAVELAKRALVVGLETLSKLMNWRDRTTCVLFGDGAGAVVLERVEDGGFLGFELGWDRSGGFDLCVPAGGSRAPASPATIEQDLHHLQMNGREVCEFATRAMVSSAEQLLVECRLTVDEVDVYVPHRANRRIIDHAVRHVGLAPEKARVNVEHYGNTSSASIRICLHEAVAAGTMFAGQTVLMSAVGAGLTWGSALVVWGDGR